MKSLAGTGRVAATLAFERARISKVKRHTGREGYGEWTRINFWEMQRNIRGTHGKWLREFDAEKIRGIRPKSSQGWSQTGRTIVRSARAGLENRHNEGILTLRLQALQDKTP